MPSQVLTGAATAAQPADELAQRADPLHVRVQRPVPCVREGGLPGGGVVRLSCRSLRRMAVAHVAQRGHGGPRSGAFAREPLLPFAEPRARHVNADG